MSAPVPDDVVPSVAVTEVRLSMYLRDTDVTAVTVKFLDRLPLRVGERVEVEVVEIERRVMER